MLSDSGSDDEVAGANNKSFSRSYKNLESTSRMTTRATC